MPASDSRLLTFIQFAIVLCVAAVIVTLLTSRPAIEEGVELPELAVAGWLNGRPPDDLSGKVVLIDVWAWWCGPCLAEMPELVELHESYAGEGVVFLGLTPEPPTELPNIQAALDNQPGATWPVGYGAQPLLESIGWDGGLPTYILVDRTGHIAWSGGSYNLEEAMLRLLAE